ncbi:hypothetical protein [Streptomyces sp. CNQ431]|nr:hypothetical protein [Streptomyces sp. CNQ431]
MACPDELPDREDRCDPQCAFLGRIPTDAPAPSAQPSGAAGVVLPLA